MNQFILNTLQDRRDRSCNVDIFKILFEQTHICIPIDIINNFWLNWLLHSSLYVYFHIIFYQNEIDIISDELAYIYTLIRLHTKLLFYGNTARIHT